MNHSFILKRPKALSCEFMNHDLTVQWISSFQHFVTCTVISTGHFEVMSVRGENKELLFVSGPTLLMKTILLLFKCAGYTVKGWRKQLGQI